MCPPALSAESPHSTLSCVHPGAAAHLDVLASEHWHRWRASDAHMQQVFESRDVAAHVHFAWNGREVALERTI